MKSGRRLFQGRRKESAKALTGEWGCEELKQGQCGWKAENEGLRRAVRPWRWLSWSFILFTPPPCSGSALDIFNLLITKNLPHLFLLPLSFLFLNIEFWHFLINYTALTETGINFPILIEVTALATAGQKRIISVIIQSWWNYSGQHTNVSLFK